MFYMNQRLLLPWQWLRPHRADASWRIMHARSYVRGSDYITLFLSVLNVKILKGKPRRVIQSLDPTRLSQSDFIDLNLSKMLHVSTTVSIRHPHSQADSKLPTFSIAFNTNDEKHRSFPADTRGFFYFVPAPHPSVHLASEVRFRITRDHDPSSFQGGSDLLLPNMTPWRIPLVVLARRSRYSGLRHLLLQDGLTTTLSLSHCAALGYSIGPKSHVIHSLGQLFALNFHENRCTVHLASADSLHKFQYHFFGERRGRGVSRVRPYAGKPGNEFTSLAES